jgi:hypothetical protein
MVLGRMGLHGLVDFWVGKKGKGGFFIPLQNAVDNQPL